MSLPNSVRNELAIRMGSYVRRNVVDSVGECWRQLKQRVTTAFMRPERDNLLAIAALAMLAVKFLDERRNPFLAPQDAHMPAARALARQMIGRVITRAFPDVTVERWRLEAFEEELMPFADAAAYYNLVLPKIED